MNLGITNFATLKRRYFQGQKYESRELSLTREPDSAQCLRIRVRKHKEFNAECLKICVY
jgi:hypothetical protein